MRSAICAFRGLLTRLIGYRPGVVNGAGVNVLVELGTATWPTPQAVAYETALEGVSQAIGLYAELIGREESADEPDVAAIAGWREQQRAWAARAQELTPLDVRAMERIRNDAEELLAEPDDDENDDDQADDDEDDSGSDDDGAADDDRD